MARDGSRPAVVSNGAGHICNGRLMFLLGWRGTLAVAAVRTRGSQVPGRGIPIFISTVGSSVVGGYVRALMLVRWVGQDVTLSVGIGIGGRGRMMRGGLGLTGVRRGRVEGESGGCVTTTRGLRTSRSFGRHGRMNLKRWWRWTVRVGRNCCYCHLA